MQYLGGKSRVAKKIANVITENTSRRDVYVEPFLGAGSVAAELAHLFNFAVLTDVSPDLMAMWSALERGWIPPVSISEDEYKVLMAAGTPISALRGFVGYGCSFGGKWKAGYARNARGDNYAKQSSNGIMRKYKAISRGNAIFDWADYRNVKIPAGGVVYCDPPYRDTTKYARLADFDSDEFWEVMAKWSTRADVFVSEYSAPPGWRSVWSGTPQASLGLADQTARVSEHLWVKE